MTRPLLCIPAARSALLRVALVAVLAGLLATAPGCAKAPEGPMGSPVVQNDVQVTLQQARLAWIDLEGPTGAARTQEPVFLLDLQVTNLGESPIRYDLNWSATQATQATGALLFVDDDEDKARPPRADNAIPPLTLGAWRYLDAPIAEATSIAPGQSVQDRLLFQRPPAGVSSLVLSLPPRIFGGDARMPLYITIPWREPGEIPEPPAIGTGETFENEDIAFTLDGTDVLYARLHDSTRGDGFSDTPLLRIRYTVANRSDRTLRYMPPRSTAADPPRLTDHEGNALSRATFGPNIRPVDQVREARQLAAGESVSDFLLFERPPRGTEQLRLYLVGQRFGSSGLIRANIPFTWQDPPLPPELTTDAPDEEGADDE